MVEHGQHADRVDIVVSTLDAQCALADGVQHAVGLDDLADALRPLQPLQTGHGCDHRIVAQLVIVQFLPARVHVATNVLVDELRVVQLELRDAARRARADHTTVG